MKQKQINFVILLSLKSEYRLTLRADNADARLTPLARDIGLVSDERWSTFEKKQQEIQRKTKLCFYYFY